ncbi:MAG: hypothetical protein K9N10_16610 [Deltaproteobacteria bacterium]|nr:hypothetical protein [Deltaproteobacteria bacterium]
MGQRCQSSPYGGGLSIRHDAEIHDHRLDFYSLRPQNFWQLVKATPAIMKGTFTHGELIYLMNGQKIRVETDRTMPVDVDGEIRTHTPAHFQVKVKALSIFTP